MAPLLPSSITGSSPAVNGEIDWTDNIDNWRAIDAEWLQSRSVVRINGATPATSDNLRGAEAKGRVYYTTNKNKVIVNVGTGGSPTYETVLSSSDVVIEDGVSTVTVGVSGHTAAGLVFTKSTGAVSIGTFTVSGTFTVADLVATNSFTAKSGSNASGLTSTTSGLALDTTSAGGTTNKVTLTTSSSKLNVDKGVVIAAGGLTVTAGGVTVTAGGITVDGASTISSGLTVNGGLAIGTPNATTGKSIAVTSGLTDVQALTATTVGATTSVTTPLLTGAPDADLKVTIPASRNLRFTAATANDFDAYFVTNSGSISSSSARMAFVVTGSNLTATSYPEGTIWIA